jgi:hypothetical protein
MSKRKKILTGIFALVIGLSVAVPMTASAEGWDHHDNGRHHHEWRWERDHDHYRAYPYTPGYAYGQRGYVPRNGQGMVDRRNPNLYWACDSDGHHCHWAPR